MKKLALIELYQHHEVLAHFCDLLADGDFEVTIFCNENLLTQLPSTLDRSKFQWILRASNISIASFLEARSAELQSCDLLFVTTALGDFKAFTQLAEAYKTILLVHNAHSFLAPQKYPYIRPKHHLSDQLRQIKVKMQRQFYYKQKLRERLHALVFPSTTILEYVQSQFPVFPKEQLLALPLGTQQAFPAKLEERITLTIPGTVSEEVRDYHLVWHLFKTLLLDLKPQIRLIFLGRPKGKSGQTIITHFQKLQHPNFQFIHFSKPLSDAAYQNYLQQTHFLLLPLKAKVRNHICWEKIGHSKISGSINDMIRHGIPALLPKHYPLENSLHEMVQRFDDTETLLVATKNWLQNPPSRVSLAPQWQKKSFQKNLQTTLQNLSQ